MEYKRFELNAKINNDHIVEGHANVYNVLDKKNDIVRAGAMTETLERAKQEGILPALLLEHDIGLFAGLWLEMDDSDKGLFVKGKILSDTPGGEKALAGLYNRSIIALSIGFDVNQYHYEYIDGKNVRVITHLTLYEVSLVSNPANSESIITKFDAITDDVATFDAITDDVTNHIREIVA